MFQRNNYRHFLFRRAAPLTLLFEVCQSQIRLQELLFARESARCFTWLVKIFCKTSMPSAASRHSPRSTKRCSRPAYLLRYRRSFQISQSVSLM
jgi:hypothetical protein